MNGELAQGIALVAHGNAFLAAPGAAPPALLTGPTFGYVGTVELETVDGETVHATDEWFEALRDHGTARLALLVPPSDPRLSVFAGGLPTLVRPDPADGEGWLAEHEVVDPDAPDRRVWNLRLSRRGLDGVEGLEAPSVEAGAEALRAALTEASAFANANDELTGFGDKLRDAAAELDADDPQPAYYDDLLPDHGYGLPARRVVAAGSQGWVFGGMGSWNDVGFEDDARQAEYERLTRSFFDASVGALVRAANSFDAAEAGQ